MEGNAEMTVEPMSSQRHTRHPAAAHTERPGRWPARPWGAARRTLGMIGAVMALGILAPGVADAASGSWLSPSPSPLESELVSPNEASISDVAFDGSGKAYAVWVHDEGATAANNDKAEHYDVMFAGRQPGGSWSAPQVIDQVASTSAYFEQVRIAVDSSGDAVIAWRENGEIGVAERAASAATWTVPLTPLAGGVANENFGLGMDGSGDVTIVWTAAYGSLSPGVYAIRRAAGAWDASPTRVDEHEPPGVGTPSLAVDSNGDALIAYVLLTEEGKGMALNVVSRGANELAWSAPQVVHSLGVADACKTGQFHLNYPQAAISNSGRAAVIWQNECHAEEANHYSAPDEVSVRDLSTWSAPTTLQENGYFYSSHPQVAIDPTGKLTAIWTPGSVPGSGSNNADLMSTELPAGLSAESSTNWGAPETIATLTDSTETAPAVATDAGGDVALAFAGYGDQTYVSYHAAGGVAWTTQGEEPKTGWVFPAVAISPSGGALAVWNRPNGKEIGSGSGYLDYEEAVAAFDAGPTLGTVQIPDGYTSQTLTFSAQVSGDWSALKSVHWDFSDGTTAEGASVTHTYEEAGEYTVTVTATDQAGNTATQSATSHIANDEEPPTITISTPNQSQHFTQGQVVDASYACQDTASGVASCTGPVANGAALDTSTLGTHSFAINAQDNATNQSTLTHDYVVDPPPVAPTTLTGAASGVSQTAATLGGSVDPNASQVSSCSFQYGTTTGYGSSAACSPPPGTGSSAVAVSAAISGLSPDTTYHFRVVATNAGGTSYGADQTLTTQSAGQGPVASTVVTGTASGVSQTTTTQPPAPTYDTTVQAKMPDVVKLAVDDARSAVLKAHISADFSISQQHLKRAPRGVLPGHVLAQSPAPGTQLTSGVGQHPVVRLDVYAGPKGDCPEQAIARGLDGMQLDAALKVLKTEKCKVDYDLHVSNGVSVPTLASVKPGKRAHSVLLKVLISDDPTKNDLHIVVFPAHSRTRLTFALNTWKLTAGEWNQWTIHVLAPNTGPKNEGIELEGARVFVDSSAVKGENGTIDPATDSHGDATINVNPRTKGLIPIAVMWTGANGVSMYGVTEVQVADRSHDRVGAQLPLENGTWWVKARGGWHVSRLASQTRARVSGNPFGSVVGALQSFFGGLFGGSTPEQQVADASSKGVDVGQMQASAKPIGETTAEAVPVIDSIFTSPSFGAAPAKAADLVALAQGMHVIAAGGGNVIAAGGGNVIAAGGGNVIAAGGGNILIGQANGVIAAGGGNVIAAGGGNVIAAGGGNVIAAGGGNVIAAGGGNVIAAGGGNVIAPGGGN